MRKVQFARLRAVIGIALPAWPVQVWERAGCAGVAAVSVDQALFSPISVFRDGLRVLLLMRHLSMRAKLD
jgi:hypothetical protein